MITLPTSSVQPAIVYDGAWLLNITIAAPSATGPVPAAIKVAPFCSASGSINVAAAQTVYIPDVFQAALTSSFVSGAMANIYGYIQDQINSGSLSF